MPAVQVEVDGAVLREGDTFALEQRSLELPSTDFVGRNPAFGIDDPVPGHAVVVVEPMKYRSDLAGGQRRTDLGSYLAVGDDLAVRNGRHEGDHPASKAVTLIHVNTVRHSATNTREAAVHCGHEKLAGSTSAGRHRVCSTASQRGYLPVPGDIVLESNLVFETNAARGQMGLSQLEQDPGLIAATRQHALEMATMDYFSHTSPVPEHETVAHRLTKTGSPLVTVGENLALLQGQPDLAKAAIAGWLESPGHRENLLNPTFTHVGFGTAVNGRDETVIVQVLAYIPVRLVGFDIQTEAIDTTSVTIVARASATVSSLLSIGGTSTPPRTLESGDNELSLELVDPQSERYHIRIRASLSISQA